jgi:hypothetical protein
MKRKLFFVSLAVLVSMLIFSGTVFADDELPAQDAPVVEAGVPVEAVIAAEDTAPEIAEEPALPAADEEAPAAEELSDPMQDVSEAPAVEEAPQSDEVLLVDEGGELMDMASQESADKIAVGDPRWKVGTQWYSVIPVGGTCYEGTSVGAGTCFEVSSNYITFAINKIAELGLMPTDRKLYVEAGDYTENVVIGNSMSLLNGLIGVDGSGFTTINGDITIEDNINGFTLSGFTINGGVSVFNSVGALLLEDLDITNPSSNGIMVMGENWGDPHVGSVTMKNVRSNDNYWAGAVIQSTGAIKITDSEFSRNNLGQPFGASTNLSLSVSNSVSGIAVDLINVESNDNDADGIWIRNSNGKVTLTKVTANNNLNRGILVLAWSKGGTVNQVAANGNGAEGVLFVGQYAPVSINNAVAKGNAAQGLYVYAKGATLKNIITENNGLDGLFLNMTSGSALLENITSSGNAGYGLDLQTDSNSPFTLKYVMAVSNGKTGINIETPGAVTLTSIQSKLNNEKGVKIISMGKVSISTIVSSFNDEEGLLIEGFPYEYVDEFSVSHILAYYCPTSVTLTSAKNAAMANSFEGNGLSGIEIHSDRPINLYNFKAVDNGSYGVYVYGFDYEVLVDVDTNTWIPVQKNSGAVKVSTTIPNYLNLSQWNDMFGLAIYSDYTVVLENTVASFNQLHGMDVQSFYNTITVKNVKANDNFGGGAIFRNADALTPKSITLTNVEFNRNMTDWGGSGVDIHSRGAITITNLAANGNGSSGASMQNELSGLGRGNITLTNATLNGNGYLGLEAYSNGTITLKNVEGSNNGDYGLFLNNNYPGFTPGITLNTVNANENQNSGISVGTYGNLTVVNATASKNARTHGGAWVDGTIQDYYNGNLGPDRWYFEAEEGQAYTIFLRADGQGASGLLNEWEMDPIMTLFDQYSNAITSGVVFNHLEYDYYQIDWTPGSGEGGLYYVDVSASADGFYRFSINDLDPTYADYSYWVNGLGYTARGNVSLTGSNTFNGNSLAGLIGWSDKAVTVSNVEASDNGTEGIYIDNQNGIANVTLSGENAVINNGWQGLRIDTNGAVSVTKLDAFQNRLDGIRILANTAGKTVLLKNVYLLLNGQNGLTLESNGVTTLNNVVAFLNQSSGAYVNTHAYNLNAINSVFMRNTDYGMMVTGYPSPFLFTYSTSTFFANTNEDLKITH